MKMDLALSPDTGDLLIENFDAQLVRDLDSVEQALRVRLQFFLGEWFLDTTAGIPFYEDILIKNPNIPNIESILKAEILETEDVIELLSFDTTFENRILAVSFKVRTEYGDTDITTSLFPGS